jgi:hypothetical protein
MLGARLAMSGPHDLFARYTFGHPERAAAELRVVLPPHVVSEVDWSSLRREPGSVVDPELRQTENDLLFTARLRTGHPLLLYVGALRPAGSRGAAVTVASAGAALRVPAR